MEQDSGFHAGIRRRLGECCHAETRLRMVMTFSLLWVVCIVTVPDFVMGLLRCDVPWVHSACDISAVLVMGAALLYLLFQIKQERRVTHLLAGGIGLLVICQCLRTARIVGVFDRLHEIKTFDAYHLVQVLDNACNGLGLVLVAAAFFTAIVDLFAAKHRLDAQQEDLSDEIARRARIEAEISLERQKYKDLVNNLPVAVYRNTPGPDGHFLEMNPAHVAMFEADSEEALLKHNVRDLYRTEFKRREISDKLLLQGYIKNEEIELVTLKGRPFWGSVTAVVKQDEKGQPYFDGIIEDITSRIEAERLLMEQRAKMVENARLVSLGIMAGGIAHEINNPLAVISGCAEQLSGRQAYGQTEGELLDKLVPIVRRNVERIQKTIQGLRALSRDASADPFVDASLDTIIANAMELCRERFRLHNVSIEAENSCVNATVECRPSQISQVILNMLNNSFDAVKDLPEKWVRLSVCDLGERVEVSVEDSGPGVQREIADRLFVPFFTTKSEQHGLGLGLSISHAIIEAHNGEMANDPSSMHTRFYFRIPKRQFPSPESE